MGFRNVCLSHATTNNNTWNDTLESWIKHGTTYWIASPLLFMLVPLMRINITCKNIKKTFTQQNRSNSLISSQICCCFERNK